MARLSLLLIFGAVGMVACAGIVLGFLGPLKHDLDAFATLRLHFSLAAVLCALFVLMVRARRLAFFFLAIGGVGLLALGRSGWASVRPLPESACDNAPLRVAVANIEGYTAIGADFAGSEDALTNAAADILVTVEMRPEYFDKAAHLRMAYPYTATARFKVGTPSGVMIFSKFPLNPIGPQVKPPNAPGYAIAQTVVSGTAVSVAGLHLSRPVIGNQKEQLSAAPSLLKGLAQPRIVLGDFNAAPWTYTVQTIANAADVMLIPGIRRTWRGTYPTPIKGFAPQSIFGAQIDHILVSRDIGVRSIKTFELPGSVHWGVVAELSVPLSQLCVRL